MFWFIYGRADIGSCRSLARGLKVTEQMEKTCLVDKQSIFWHFTAAPNPITAVVRTVVVCTVMVSLDRNVVTLLVLCWFRWVRALGGLSSSVQRLQHLWMIHAEAMRVSAPPMAEAFRSLVPLSTNDHRPFCVCVWHTALLADNWQQMLNKSLCPFKSQRVTA